MTKMPFPPKRSWPKKFFDAFLGIELGVRGQSSFRVHCIAAAIVLGLAYFFGVELFEWCLLVLAITAVMAAEMFNSALEWMARAIDVNENPQLAGALDIASAAVLLSALGATAVGVIIFLKHLGLMLSWW